VTAGAGAAILPAMRILPIALLTAALGLGLAGVAQANDIKPPSVPSTTLQPPKGHKPFKLGHAVGVEIYTCTGPAWSSATPRADLYNDNGKKKWIHFGGPTWQHKDGSSVVALLPPAGNVTVNATAIPWLLLQAKSTAPGPFGDQLVPTTYIQRVNTAGGLAPALPCVAGTVQEVPYTADYYFWKAK
jgi:hypothetical protein